MRSASVLRGRRRGHRSPGQLPGHRGKDVVVGQLIQFAPLLRPLCGLLGSWISPSVLCILGPDTALDLLCMKVGYPMARTSQGVI